MYLRVNLNFNYVPRAMPEPTNLTERLATVLNGLRDVAAHYAAKNRAFVPVTILLSLYLTSVIRRFGALAARLAAGPIHARPPRPRPPQPRPPQPDAARERAPPKPRTPRRFSWLVVWLGYHAAGYGLQLRHILANDHEMAALIAASPQAGRILRPLCRMLGIKPAADLPPSLFPPRPAKAPTFAAAAEPAIPGPPRTFLRPGLSERGEETDGTGSPVDFPTPA